jgi:hypothetical protein
MFWGNRWNYTIYRIFHSVPIRASFQRASIKRCIQHCKSVSIARCIRSLIYTHTYIPTYAATRKPISSYYLVNGFVVLNNIFIQQRTKHIVSKKRRYIIKQTFHYAEYSITDLTSTYVVLENNSIRKLFI